MYPEIWTSALHTQTINWPTLSNLC